MAVFSYSGRAADGSSVTGTLEADSTDGVVSQLQAQQITPVKISAQQSAAAKAKKASSAGQIRLFERITLDELIMFSRQMYSLTRAGIPITNALRGLGATTENRLLQESLQAMAADLERGVALSVVMRKHPKLFSELYVSMMHIGENTGRLDHSFQQMAGYLELERETRKNIKQATRYPMFVSIAIFAAIMLINVVVIPQFKAVFDRFGADLPWQTQVLIGMSDFMVNYWYLLLGGIGAAVFAFVRWKKQPPGRNQWDRIRLRLPIMGSIIYRATLGRFCRTFSVVLKAGMPIEQGLVVVSRALDNLYLGDKVMGMRTGIERGEGFVQTAHRADMFSPLVMQMLAVGEETGRVDQMLEEAADFYEQEVDYQLKNLTSAIEPILIIAIGIMVLILALGVFLPLWELSTTING